MKNPNLWKFIIGQVVVVALYFAGKYASTSLYNDLAFVLPIVEAVIVAIIIGPEISAYVAYKRELHRLDILAAQIGIAFDENSLKSQQTRIKGPGNE